MLTGVVRGRRPFGVFVDLGGIEGLVRNREVRAEDSGPGAPELQEGEPVNVVVIGMDEATHRVDLSMRRASDRRTPLAERSTRGPVASPTEGPMALAFRLARERKKQAK